MDKQAADFLQVAKNFHQANYTKERGALGFPEFRFVFSVLEDKQPETFLEVGTASGITTALVKLSLDFLGLDSLIGTLDVNYHLDVDKTKKIGFVLDELDDRTNVDLFLGKTSFDLDEILAPNSIDLCLIDADHFHPWATLDTINVLPFLRKPAVLIYHDINLYKFEHRLPEIGPRYIFDQLSGRKRIANTQRKNIGSVVIDKQHQEYIEALVDALYFPWTCKPSRKAEDLKEIVSKYYDNDAGLLEHIEAVYARFDPGE